MTTRELLRRAKGAKAAMALADTEMKNRALLAMADALLDKLRRHAPYSAVIGRAEPRGKTALVLE